MLDPDQPSTAPAAASDPRAGQILGNVYQVAQGGRYFTWYGCGSCHGSDARGALDLGDPIWRHGGTIDRIYQVIAEGHGSLGRRIPAEQLWQLSAYTLTLPTYDPAYRRRQDLDQSGEPTASTWQGAIH